MKIIIIIVAFFCAQAYSQENASPDNVMSSYARAVNAWDVDSMSDLMHPDELKRLREAFNNAFSGDKSESARAALLPLLSAKTYSEFQNLSDREVYRRMVEYIEKLSPELLTVMASAKYEITGQQQSNDEVIVQYRLTMNVEGQSISQDAVQRVKQHEGSWFLMLPPESEATIAGIDAQF